MDVVILGSCISRDVIESRETALKVRAQFTRTSLLTQAFPPVDVNETDITGLSGFETRSVVREFRRTLNEDLFAQPCEVLLVDLLEERWPLAEIGGQPVLWTQFIADSGALAGRELKPVDRGVYGPDAFAKACQNLAGMLEGRNVRVILHRVSLAEGYRDQDGFHDFDEPTLRYGREVYPVIRSLEEDFIAAFPDAIVLETDEQPVSDPNHKWGLASFHYTPDYYERMLVKMEAALAEPPPPAPRPTLLQRAGRWWKSTTRPSSGPDAAPTAKP